MYAWVIAAALLAGGAPSQQDLRALEKRTFEEVNQQRRNHGLPALVWNEKLAELARQHSADMASEGYFSHAAPSGTTLADRLNRAGIRWSKIAENILEQSGYEDPAAKAVQGWMKSLEHRRNILDPKLKQTGVGLAVASDGTLYFTQEFMTPASAGTAATGARPARQ